jgi:fructose-specific component phosphotransferase system IIB-like protein
MTRIRVSYLLTIATVVGACAPSADDNSADRPRQATMSFFLTSAGPGNGADLGGLEGADAYCQSLAAAVGEGGATWRAYMSATATADAAAVSARDRIGTGPWYNHALVQVASAVDNLHSENNNLTKETVLNERGGITNGSWTAPRSRAMTTPRATIGRAVGRAARWSVTSTAPVAARTPRPGTRPTPVVAAARRTYRARAVTDCSTASRHRGSVTDPRPAPCVQAG